MKNLPATTQPQTALPPGYLCEKEKESAEWTFPLTGCSKQGCGRAEEASLLGAILSTVWAVQCVDGAQELLLTGRLCRDAAGRQK